ncbi:recombinase family protein [Caproiciproducens sp.]
MKAVAYCRVSTNKEEQLDSLESQQQFFLEYARRNEYNLVKIYADEGKSGTKMKNRTQLLRLLADAQVHQFDIVLIKDVSRLARNTVDFLTSIRKMKALGIKVIFVNYDQTSSDSSEFMLTMLSAIAQEESSNTSKRVKFGKKQNAEKGRVPNLVYGYDKIPDDYFSLSINEQEAKTIREIFNMYLEGNGETVIAVELNRRGLKTKRNCNWSQNAVARILSNQIYVGKIINGKQEVSDFLTGKRRQQDEAKWLVTERPKLRLIDDITFRRAQAIIAQKRDTFNHSGERSSQKNTFSKLIKCTCCGNSFRRSVRTFKNTYIKWSCTGRSANGVDTCPNRTILDEQELLDSIRSYFRKILSDKPNVIRGIVAEFNRQYQTKDENQISERELTARLNKETRSKQKYLEMYENEIISMEELREKTKELNGSIVKLEEELKLVQNHISKSDLLESGLNETFRDIDTVLKADTITNGLLHRVLDSIQVDEKGNVDIYLKVLREIGLPETVQLSNDCT